MAINRKNKPGDDYNDHETSKPLALMHGMPSQRCMKLPKHLRLIGLMNNKPHVHKTVLVCMGQKIL